MTDEEIKEMLEGDEWVDQPKRGKEDVSEDQGVVPGEESAAEASGAFRVAVLAAGGHFPR